MKPLPFAKLPPTEAGHHTAPEGLDASNPGEPVRVVIATRQLLQGRSLVHLEHDGLLYRLQVTRQGKLILTK